MGRRRRWIALGIVLAAAACRTPPPPPPVPEPLRADAVVVEKARRRLVLVRDGRVLRSYRVALGRNPHGPKRAAGDGRTPEGRYLIDFHNPESKYHLSLHVSYPDDVDRRRAEEAGVDPGGDVVIHGWPNEMDPADAAALDLDWTEGCIAVTNDDMDEIWDLVPDGTPIEIRP